ncbi:putative ferredoxin [Nocardia nova SH22a]|uniref:Putative ferredoxin n=1 Tax=Nocardia nova SH22a TaxID=1415166 RepID=W5TF33_9NOCA|nr:ferredoxin [Nocardia nova]AHH17769.1 putative ferredoxin [Nocardia nova SH22a]
MRINIDPQRCEGHALCAGIAPGVFEVGPDDLAEVVDDNPGEDSWRQIRAAANSCPTLAISLNE